MRPLIIAKILSIFLSVVAFHYAHSETLISFEEFLENAFGDGLVAKQEKLWISKETKSLLSKDIDYQLNQIRMGYWVLGQRTAWVLEEIGKEKPITIGVVVENAQIVSIHVLEYRESRGAEVKYDFFTRQFQGAQFKDSVSSFRLNRRIDGITGATLSVRAVKKVAKLALFLHQLTPYSHVKEE